MKICVTTSNSYHHCLRVAVYLFNRNWSADQQVEIVGYDKPDFDLPENFTFYSLGKQIGGAENFSTDLRPYFEKQDDFFIWMMDDTFPVSVDFGKLAMCESLTKIKKCGKVNLTRATRIQNHRLYNEMGGEYILEQDQISDYRLATQPSIWNRDYLLKYLTPELNPWKFETQPAHNDGWRIFGLEDEPLIHNEGTTKHNIWKLDLHGIPKEQIHEMEDLGILTEKMEYERMAR